MREAAGRGSRRTGRPTITVVFIALAAVVMPATARAQEGSITCPYRGVNPAARRSPLDSVTLRLGGQDVRICYGRPSSRGRVMIGGAAAPFGRVWRAGANETTIIRSPIALDIAGIAVGPGTYALYAIPGENAWQVIVNRSWRQWGREIYYTEEVAAQEVGRATVPVERLDEHIETLTIRAEPDGPVVVLILEWERTRIRIPVRSR